MGLEHLEFTKKILPPEEAFVIANEHYAHALPNSKALWGTRRKWITMTAPYSSQYTFIAITAKMRHVWSVLPPAPLARIPSGSQCFSYKSPPPGAIFHQLKVAWRRNFTFTKDLSLDNCKSPNYR